MRWPGVIEPGSVDEHMVQNIDFAATFLDAAGVSVPEDMHGESLVPLMTGKSPRDWRRSIYYHYYEYPGVHAVRRHYGVRTERYKLMRFYGHDVVGWELFDLEGGSPRDDQRPRPGGLRRSATGAAARAGATGRAVRRGASREPLTLTTVGPGDREPKPP